MKMKLLLFLSGVLWVSAGVLHEDRHVDGCSDSDGESVYALDREVLWYANFQRGEGVEPLPPFVDNISYPGGYELAVANQQVCRMNLKTMRTAMKDIPDENDPPYGMTIYPRDDVELGEKNILICHVSGFYPAPVNVSWTKNGQEVTEGTSINVPFLNKDFTFTQISRLQFVPQMGDIYSCSVEHVALTKPQTRTWDVELNNPQSGLGPTIFCGVGLTIGLLGAAVGIYFVIKRNKCS
ncbi:H-2 class II histocompatibility antigen, A-U alpha chain-like [Poecilia reticulata]|uniref:H-2 class II histocompatibility antigen, A-U alpha chain-like n=1 Tax=Poecilia reticulata TaxID=8081 RepID=A0A3P9NR41_POERE|nr:PREDICTED: H-2 class II histocompatibility antigen, A-U alpha chain-like [Poecilia reticulata]